MNFFKTGKLDKLYSAWSLSKFWWKLYVILSLAGLALVLYVGLTSQEFIRAFGNAFSILLHPAILVIFGFVLGNVEALVLFYIAYDSGKKMADKASTLFLCTMFPFIFYLLYLGLLGFFGYLTGTFQNTSAPLLLSIALGVLGTPVFAAICWVLYHLGTKSRPNSKTEKKPSYIFAGFRKRFMTKVIDSLVLIFFIFIWSAFSLPIFMLLDEQLNIDSAGAWLLATCIYFDFYFFIFHWRFGTTIGKKWFDLKVIKVNGGNLSFVDSFMRTLGEYITRILFLSYYLIGFDKEKQGWHDKLAETFVVEVRN